MSGLEIASSLDFFFSAVPVENYGRNGKYSVIAGN